MRVFLFSLLIVSGIAAAIAYDVYRKIDNGKPRTYAEAECDLYHAINLLSVLDERRTYWRGRVQAVEQLASSDLQQSALERANQIIDRYNSKIVAQRDLITALATIKAEIAAKNPASIKELHFEPQTLPEWPLDSLEESAVNHRLQMLIEDAEQAKFDKFLQKFKAEGK